MGPKTCGSKNRAGRTPSLGRDAQRLLLAASTPIMAVSIRSGPKPAGALNEHRELRASRWGGSFGPRGSASRRNSINKSAQTTTKGSAQFCRVRAARSGGGPKAQRAGPAVLRTAEAQHFLSDSSSARPPHAPLKRRPRRGRRFCESRYSLLAQNPAKSKAQPTAPCSARRSGKTVAGFPAPRTGKAQCSPQFSAPCQPHCGSAVAPPRLPSPAGISSRFCSPQNERNPS